MGEDFDIVAAGEDTGWPSVDPYRLADGTDSVRFRTAVAAARTRQLDIVGQARDAMASRGIRFEVLMGDFASACVIPGVDAGLVDAPEMAELHLRLGYVPVGPAIRFSSPAIETRQVTLGIDPNRRDVRFVLLDASLDRTGWWRPEYPSTIKDLEAFFDKLAFIAGDIQAKSIVTVAKRHEVAEAGGAPEPSLSAFVERVVSLTLKAARQLRNARER